MEANNLNISASSSRMFTNYEISDELIRVHVQYLERKYGGRLRAHTAATRIQRAYRHYRLRQQWHQVINSQFFQPVFSNLRSNFNSNEFAKQIHLEELKLRNLEKNAHFKKLAQSQPLLKYQPVTSLRAQLKAEQRNEGVISPNSLDLLPAQTRINMRSPLNSTIQTNTSTRIETITIKNTQNLSSQQRPYLELMSPILSQRRVVMPIVMSNRAQYSASSSFGENTMFGKQEGGIFAEDSCELSSRQFRRVSSPLNNTSNQNQSPRQQNYLSKNASAFKNSASAVNPTPVSLSNEVVCRSTTTVYNTNSLPRMDKRQNDRIIRIPPTTQPTESIPTISRVPTTTGTPKLESEQKQMLEWTDQQRRRLYRIALNFFNKKPERGIQLLINWGFVEENPRSIARLFLERRGLSKQMIGEFLGTIKTNFYSQILENFVNEIPMYDMDIDIALRQLLTYFRLPGEAQKIDHIIQAFAKRYCACNPNRLPANISSDTIYILAFAIIMLNTDLHTPSLKDSKRMKLDEFIKNIQRIEEGQHLDREILQGIYERVKEFEFRSGSDHVTQVMKVDQSIIGKDKPKLIEPHRRLICYCRLNQVLDANKKQALNAHQREIFLFNDMLLIAKILNKKKTPGPYTLRFWTTLIGVRIEEFQNAFYNFGLIIYCPDGQQLLFNAKNNDDRFRFRSDVWESVAEATEMEQLRLELELDKQSNGGGRLIHLSNRFSRVDSQRDSGIPDIDHQSPSLPPPNSLNFAPPTGCCALSAGVSIQNLHNSSSPSASSLTTATNNNEIQINGRISNSSTPKRRIPTTETTSATSSGFEEGAVYENSIGGGISSIMIDGASLSSKTKNVEAQQRISYNSMDSGMLDLSV